MVHSLWNTSTFCRYYREFPLQNLAAQKGKITSKIGKSQQYLKIHVWFTINSNVFYSIMLHSWIFIGKFTFLIDHFWFICLFVFVLHFGRLCFCLLVLYMGVKLICGLAQFYIIISSSVHPGNWWLGDATKGSQHHLNNIREFCWES